MFVFFSVWLSFLVISCIVAVFENEKLITLLIATVRENYFKLKKESDYLDSLIDKNIYLERKKKEKELHRIIKRYYKNGNSKGNI